MTPAPFGPRLPDLGQRPARALPWATVVAGSLVTAWPVVTGVPVLPPCGLLMLLAWRLLAPFALRPWAAAPLGLVDDLLSGQPLGSAVLLWSVCFLLIEMIERRQAYRDWWRDWSAAAGLIAFCLFGGRLLAVRVGAPVDGAVMVQVAISILLFPAAARVVAFVDRKRGQPG